MQQNEYTTWLSEDKHAGAYQVLFSERSENIARNLKVKNAATDDRCLACHTNQISLKAMQDSPRLAEEALSGIGCEACHGHAEKWLGPHTRKDWKNNRAAVQTAGMTLEWDFLGYAQKCVVCHVGTPARSGLPLGDVNHDLIAAGHPRLHFEFAVFLANLPRHWSEATQNKLTAESEAKAWAVGQLTSAHAALELLEYRAGPAKTDNAPPWPEFAEYDCFACHHDLKDPSWRQKSNHYGKHKPGELPWGHWYFSMPEAVAKQVPERSQFAAALDELTLAMRRPFPERARAAQQARNAADLLVPWQQQLAGGSFDAALFRKMLASDDIRARLSENWDVTEQVYLAASALAAGDEEKMKAAIALGRGLAFEAHKTYVYDSARQFRPEAFQQQLGELLKQFGR